MPNHPNPTLVHSVSFADSVGQKRVIEIWVGDIATVTEISPVDLFVLSAFPNDYVPYAGTVIRRLSQVGIDVARAAADKLSDHRNDWQSWVSRPLTNNPLLKQLICFEPAIDDQPAIRVGSVFRTVREHLFSKGESSNTDVPQIDTLRMSLLATGNRQASKREMLEAILSQSWLHLGACLPIKRLQLFLHPGEETLFSLLLEAGIQLEQAKSRWMQDFGSSKEVEWDLFISYRHADIALLQPLIDELKRIREGLRLFIDRNELTPGGYWKQDLIHGLSRSRHVLCFITDDYPKSVECMDEFHASVLRSHRKKKFLVPVLNLHRKSISHLPESIRRVHCIQAELPNQPVQEIAEMVVQRMENL